MNNFSTSQNLVKANSYFKKNRLDEACELYLQVLQTFPENSRAIEGLIRSHEKLVSQHLKTLYSMLHDGQLKLVLEQAQMLTRKFTHAFSLWNLLGIAFTEHGSLSLSIECYKKALIIKPDHAQVFNNLGNSLRIVGDIENAITSFQQAINIKANYALAHINLGLALNKKGEFKQAIKSYQEAIRLNPNDANLYIKVGNIQMDDGNSDAAIRSYKKALKISPNSGTANHMLAAVTGITPDTASREYVEHLFDAYAPSFEDSLINNLQYAMPRALAKVAIEHQPKRSFGSILDLGCGTGLMGLELRELTQKLEGIDLSSEMLKQAYSKEIYDRLTQGDIVEFLKSAELDFNYYFAADVFIYIGNLFEIFALIKNRNKEGGKLIFSTEHSEKDGFVLEQSGRYSHSKNYIQELCEELNYQMIHFSQVDLRREREKLITGGIYLLNF